jgi:hypothetical protein
MSSYSLGIYQFHEGYIFMEGNRYWRPGRAQMQVVRLQSLIYSILKASALGVGMRTFLAVTFLCVFAYPAAALTDSEVRAAIIQESLSGYPGPCPCPYNTMRNGRACGGRSAYSRPGGYSPVCYVRDITQDMMRRYRASHGG